MKAIRKFALATLLVLGMGALNHAAVQDWNPTVFGIGVPMLGVTEVNAGERCKWGFRICQGDFRIGCIDTASWWWFFGCGECDDCG